MSKLIDPQKLTKKDFETDQDVRWCPGCGDYSILANVQKLMPELGIHPDQMVWVSGIGCSSRFPYYMNTYGFHTIHGRAPAIATGIRVANPKLSVWLATGDGDGLSIGGNHLMHILRRNVDVRILMFNNRIYGLTKGQYSPTSEQGKVTKSTPFGSVDQPLDPASFALGVRASFVARAIDTDAKNLSAVLRRAAEHRGSAFTEIYQNCNVFNDGAFDAFREKEGYVKHALVVSNGQPLRFGENQEQGLRLDPRTFSLQVVTLGQANEDGHVWDESDLLVHDETNLALASLLAQMPFGPYPVALGVLYAVRRPSYEESLASQGAVPSQSTVPSQSAVPSQGASESAAPSLDQLLRSGDTWTVS